MFVMLLAAALAAAGARESVTLPSSPRMERTLPGGDLVGVARDSASGQPIVGAEVVVIRAGRVVARTQADAFGRFRIHDLPPGDYDVEIRSIGYQASRSHASVGQTGDVQLVARLAPSVVQLKALEVTAPVPVEIDTRTGEQLYKQYDYHGAPTQTTSQILQQSVAGAARAPTGEVHIRGQHAEYTYYVDGVPVPAGISGSLNELFNPDVVNDIAFQTGAWDAEYGNKNAAVVNVHTRIPTGTLRASGSAYAGSRVTNGQTLAVSDNVGKLGWFVSGSRQRTNMRREPVMADPLTGTPLNFSNFGEDLFGFGKLQYLPSAGNIVNLEGNWSQTRSQIPFDSSGGAFIHDSQRDRNAFVNLSWQHQFPTHGAQSSELFAAAFHRRGTLNYVPGVTDVPQFVFFPDTLTPFNLTENRNFNATGFKLDYTYRTSEHVQFKVGGLASVTRGHEDFQTLDQNGNPGPASNSDLRGSDQWAYAQTVVAPTEKVEIRAGVRFDNHNAPFAGNQNQLSPRIKFSLFPDPQTTLYAYYGRLFVPTNVEDLRAITSVAQAGVAADPTLPERDHFFEVGALHRFPAGVVFKLSAYHKRSSPGIDDNTVPGSSIVTSVNIGQVRVTGIETVVEVRPRGRFSGYMNLALNHAYGIGPITGGFFPASIPPGFFDLDHDQRLSGLVNVNYADQHLFASLTGTYGTGLTNGADPDSTYGRGLFDFNRSIKVPPSFILNASAGYVIPIGGLLLRPEVYVDNILNHKYLMKGAFFSGASFGRPRSVLVRLNFAM